MMVFMTTQDHAMNYAPWKCELKHQERLRTEKDIDDKLQNGGCCTLYRDVGMKWVMFVARGGE